MNYKAAVFDCDGTLLDSMYVWRTCGSKYLKLKGFEPPEGFDELFSDFDLDRACAVAREDYGIITTPEGLLEDLFKVAREEYLYKVQAKPGIREALMLLREKGIAAAVATASPEFLIRPALERNGLWEYFDVFLSTQDMGISKESPDIYDRAAELLGASKPETLVFEDALYAARTADAAGYPVVGVYDVSERKQEELRSVSAYFTDDILDFVSNCL